MHPRREAKGSPAFLLNSTDPSGRPIDPTILAIAQQLAPQAISHAERSQIDPAVATSLLEKAAAMVSKVIEEKRVRNAPPIRDVSGYLFRSFIRLIDHESKKTTVLDNALIEYALSRAFWKEVNFAENQILKDEILAIYDRLTREIVLTHSSGFSWEEIGPRFGISPDAARVRFHRALEQARRKLGIPIDEG